MKTARVIRIFLLALVLLVCQAKVNKATEIGTAFTYQGHLYDNNSVADDFYDFQFKLYDANVGGSKAANDVNVADVDVIDGYFTVVLDFNDPCTFNGEARWLEIGIRPGDLNDPCTYTPLLPRQELTPIPYALYAKTAGSAGGDSDWMVSGNDMYSMPSGNVGIGTASPQSHVHIDDSLNATECSAQYHYCGRRARNRFRLGQYSQRRGQDRSCSDVIQQPRRSSLLYQTGYFGTYY
jgi:hypothetical protein